MSCYFAVCLMLPTVRIVPGICHEQRPECGWSLHSGMATLRQMGYTIACLLWDLHGFSARPKYQKIRKHEAMFVDLIRVCTTCRPYHWHRLAVSTVLSSSIQPFAASCVLSKVCLLNFGFVA